MRFYCRQNNIFIKEKRAERSSEARFRRLYRIFRLRVGLSYGFQRICRAPTFQAHNVETARPDESFGFVFSGERRIEVVKLRIPIC